MTFHSIRDTNGYKVRSIDSQEYKISTYAEVLRRRFSPQQTSDPKIGSPMQAKNPSSEVGERPEEKAGDEQSTGQRPTNDDNKEQPSHIHPKTAKISPKKTQELLWFKKYPEHHN